MIKNYFLILAVLCCVLFTGCKKEDVSIDTKIPSDPAKAFPDRLFREYVLRNFDTDGDGKISEEEALAVTEIDVSNIYDRNDDSKTIKSLNGIQYFTNLMILRCFNNQLTTLDLSKNTALTYLNCSENQLTTLDFRKNTRLKYLNCRYNQLTTLDVSNNTALTWLDCCNNQFTTLDLSKNTALTELYCRNNLIEELDLSKTNLVNSEYNNNSTSSSPFYCAPMETLKKVYLKKGWRIKGVTEDWNRSNGYIPDHTEIIFVD